MEETWDGLPVSPEPPYGAAVLVWARTPTGPLFLLLHRAHLESPDARDWAGGPPAGARLPGEEIAACAQRELREETCLEAEIAPTSSAPRTGRSTGWNWRYRVPSCSPKSTTASSGRPSPMSARWCGRTGCSYRLCGWRKHWPTRMVLPAEASQKPPGSRPHGDARARKPGPSAGGRVALAGHPLAAGMGGGPPLGASARAPARRLGHERHPLSCV